MKKKPKEPVAEPVGFDPMKVPAEMIRQRFVGRRMVLGRDLKRNPLNWRTHPDDQRRDVSRILSELGQLASLLAVDRPEGPLLVDGQLRADIADDKLIAVDFLDLTDEEVKLAITLFDSVGYMAGINAEIAAQVAEELRAERPDWGTEIETFRTLCGTHDETGPLPPSATAPAPAAGAAVDRLRLVRQKLTERFVVPPMSVLDARQGYWSERRKAWLALGIKSEEGRGSNLLNFSETLVDPTRSKTQEEREAGYTSVFDPVVCELAYRWFSAPGAVVLDPFCGGSVRGIVASMLGRVYHGVDLRAEQIEANQKQAEEILGPDDPAPTWRAGDALDVAKLLPGVKADLIFSCPPYGNLEKYSEDPRDVSTLEYPAFLKAYRKIIAEAAKLLKRDGFAVWVVGDFRNKAGAYQGFVADTIRAFADAGMGLYNEAILFAVGTAAIRAGRLLQQSRKIVKTHQNVLVFVKGDWRKVVEGLGPVEYGEVPTGWIDGADLETTVENAALAGGTEFGERLTAADLGGEV